jgi:hypothetical protein
MNVVSIHTTKFDIDLSVKFFTRLLGQDPQYSLSLFLRGLGLFALGALFIAMGYYGHHYWQIIGVVFIALGASISACGYVGMFINRLKNMINHNKK